MIAHEGQLTDKDGQPLYTPREMAGTEPKPNAQAPNQGGNVAPNVAPAQPAPKDVAANAEPKNAADRNRPKEATTADRDDASARTNKGDGPGRKPNS